MTLFKGNQIRHSTWGRTVLSAVLVAWLTTALQPCLMAMELSPDPATGMAMSMPDHAGHAVQDEASPVQPCAHCPTTDTQGYSSCESAVQADCDRSPNYYDARTAKVKDAPSTVPIGIAPSVVITPCTDYALALPGPADRSFVPGDPPALNVLYGVFLI